MDYLEFLFFYDTENSFIGDLLAAELAEIGFESFLEDEQNLAELTPDDKPAGNHNFDDLYKGNII